MRKNVHIIPLLYTSIGCILSAQNTVNNFNAAAKLGTGSAIFPTGTTVTKGSDHMKAYPSFSITFGILGEYTIAETFGVAAGYQLSWQHLDNNKDIYFLGNGSLNETVSYSQIPIIFFYKHSPLKWPYKYLKFRAGTSLDWIRWNEWANPYQYKFLGNITTGISYGLERSTGRILEFGIEYTRSLKSYQRAHHTLILTSKMDILSLNFYYYIFKK